MIGVFDSGYGGLTVLKELLKRLPQYDYLYLGDNGRAPYGGRDPETIQQYAREAVEFLFKQGCRLILVACNTVSAVALRGLQENYIRTNYEEGHGAEDKVNDEGSGAVSRDWDRNILGVIFPLVEKAAEISAMHTRMNPPRIGVVGTRATIESGAYEHELKKLRPDATIYGQACPLLVPFIEEGWESKPEALMILRKYLRPLKTYNLDTLILGCTHYPLMHRAFEQIMGKNAHVLDTGPTVAESLAAYFERHPELEKTVRGVRGDEGEPGRSGKANTGMTAGILRFCTTGDPMRFKELGSRFLGRPMNEVERVSLAP